MWQSLTLFVLAEPLAYFMIITSHVLFLWFIVQFSCATATTPFPFYATHHTPHTTCLLELHAHPNDTSVVVVVVLFFYNFYAAVVVYAHCVITFSIKVLLFSQLYNVVAVETEG